ncbi:unnamed protein product [Clonostachys rhizophaga]|uniref:C2H2-type domain-containing protein n=1 Tax=Clonostachys rhizophaga TaxID=160324 RepID=A0A9N9VKT0_9HYPO|nr:unnamed protein product [Clonostachys rhizophaga]
MTAFLARSERPSGGRIRTKQSKPTTCKFSCTHCEATFKRVAHLRRHDKTRTFLFSYRFTGVSTLTVASASLDQNEKPYRCELCPVSSSRKDVILRHTRNFHPEIASANAEDDLGPISDAEHVAPSVNASTPPSASPRMASADPTLWALSSPGDPEQSGDGPKTPASQALLTEGVKNLENGPPVPAATQLLELELCSNEDTGSSGMTLPDHEILDFLAASDLAMPNTWGIFASGATPFLNPAEFLPNWERDAPVTALVEHPPPVLPISYSHDSPSRSCFTLTNDEYKKVVANFVESDPSGALLQFQYPSKHAVIRFVRAFFKHMAPQFPVLHPPTFDVTLVPTPLLIEIMACGAMYSRERRTAEKLHRVGLQLSSEHWKRGSETQLWLLQANLLMTFFEAYNADWKVPQRAISMLSETAKLAHEAYSAIKGLSKSNYKNWVRLENHRCIAGMIIIGATLNSTMKEEYCKMLGMDFDFTLPAMTSVWMKNEGDWEQPVDAPDISETMRLIHTGKRYDLSLSDLGLLTIVSTFLAHVSSFELLTGSRHPLLWTAFVSEMSGPVQVLDELCKRPSACMSEDGITRSPLLKTARALLDSIYYHLYGSSQLSIMKELLGCPDILVDSESFNQLLRALSTNNFDKALKRAAEVFLEETRQGLQYLGSLDASHFGPVSTTAVFERGLILCCYLQTRPSHSPMTSSQSPLDALISEGITEVESQQVSDYKQTTSAIPLLASSMILRDTSVWKWPPVVSSKLEALVEKLNLVS